MWWLGLAMAASPYRDVAGDVVAEATVPLRPDEVTALVSDLRRVPALFDEICLARWAVGSPASGEGARAGVVYTPSWMNRRLTLVVHKIIDGRWVEWTHEGSGSFTTYWTVEAVDGGAHVRLETPLKAQPWPLRKLFFEKVRPAWTECYTSALSRLGAR